MPERSLLALHNVLVMVLADGEVADAEQAFVHRLRERLGIEAGRFNEVLGEIRRGQRKIEMPAEHAEAVETIRLLAEAAAADGEIGPIERRVLEAMARHVGMSPAAMEELAARAEKRDIERLAALLDETYERFAGWTPDERRRHFAAIAEFGRYATRGLLRILESYRVPAGAADALELKEMVVDTLGSVGDERVVYYLATQVGLEGSDELTSASLRAAAAEALGRIAGERFTRDAAGVERARAWWFCTGLGRYDALCL